MAQIHALNSVVVLVEPQMPQNIGAAARAMANFGFTRLRLVRPREQDFVTDALPMAAGADDIVTQAQVFDTIAEALHDCTFSAAFTARPRTLIKPVYTPQTLPPALGTANALVFGAERAGLSTHDIALCHAIVHVQTVPNFSSLNLAQCVLLVCAYVYAADAPAIPQASYVPAPHNEVMGLITHLSQALEERDYFYPPNKKPIMHTTLHNMLMRANFTSDEVRTWRGIVRTLTQKTTP